MAVGSMVVGNVAVVGAESAFHTAVMAALEIHGPAHLGEQLEVSALDQVLHLAPALP